MAKQEKKVDKRSKAYKDSIKKEQEQPLELEVSVEESLKRMNILEHMPEPLLNHMYKIIGCDCTIKAYDEFISGTFIISKVLQIILNQVYYNLFNERVHPTSCSTCMNRRLKRIRETLSNKINP